MSEVKATAMPIKKGIIVKIIGMILNIITLGLAKIKTVAPIPSNLRYLVFKYSYYYPSGGMADLADAGNDLADLVLKHKDIESGHNGHIYDTFTQEIILLKKEDGNKESFMKDSLEFNKVDKFVRVKE